MNTKEINRDKKKLTALTFSLDPPIHFSTYHS